MKTLHNRSVRLATWIGGVSPDPKQSAFIEHSMDHARSWLRYGEKRMQVWRAAKAAPSTFHLQAN